MKFACNPKTLARAVKTAILAAGASGRMCEREITITAPADGGMITVESSRSAVEPTRHTHCLVSVPAEIDHAGRATFRADLLRKALAGVAQRSIEIDCNSTHATLDLGQVVVTVPTLFRNAKAAPPLPRTSIKIKAELLERALRWVNRSMSDDGGRHAIRGIMFYRRADDQVFRVLSTNGHRVARWSRKIKGDLSDEFGWLNERTIIDREAVEALVEALPGASRVEIGRTDCGKTCFGIDGHTLVYSEVRVEPISVERVLPKESEYEESGRRAVLDRKSAMDALKRMSRWAGRQRYLRLENTSAGLTARNSKTSETPTAVQIPRLIGNGEWVVCLNYDYLVDAIKTMESQSVDVSVLPDLRAARLAEIGGHMGERADLYIMPLRL